MLSTKLKSLMAILETNNSELSQAAHLDRSTVSKIGGGTRKPKAGSETAGKLAAGLLRLTKQKGKRGEIAAEIFRGIGEEEEAVNKTQKKLTESALLSYLYRGEEEKTAERKSVAKEQSAAGPRFGERLNAVMKLCDISASRLSHMVHVDASLISRYRSGERIPRSGGNVIRLIGNALFRRIIDANKIGDLAMLIGREEEEPDELRFLSWLTDYTYNEEQSVRLVETLVDSVKLFDPGTKFPLPEFTEAVTEEILAAKDRLYQGMRGLQTAVLRFLGTAVRQGGKELYLYSDQGMEWITDDRTFFARWSALMVACVRSGIRIHIIHNLERGSEEMLQAVTSWVPLYMSGMIESFYSDKPVGERFTHTLFLCPGVCCIEGNNVAGNEKSAVYRFITEPEELIAMKNQYDSMLRSAHPLIHTEEITRNILPEGDLILVRSAGSMLSGAQALSEFPENEREEIRESLKKVKILEYLTGEKGCIPDPAEGYPGYTAIHMQEAPFTDVNILIGEKRVAVVRTKQRMLAFVISHPLMCKAFREYVRWLG